MALQRTRLNPIRAHLAVLLTLTMAGCGGGGGATSSIVQPTTAVPAFAANNATEAAYLQAFELASTLASPGQGYIANAFASNGAIRRRLFEFNGTGYSESSAVVISDGLTSAATSAGGDQWLTQYTAGGAYQIAAQPTGYILKVNGENLFRIDSIAEIDIAGQAFAAHLLPTALGGISGVFPAGSRAYVANVTTLVDMYTAQAVSSVAAGTANSSYLSTRYGTAALTLCFDTNKVLMFTSPTQVLVHNRLAAVGGGCTAAIGAPLSSHTVNMVERSGSTAARKLLRFDISGLNRSFVDNTYPFIAKKGNLTLGVSVLVEDVSPGQVAEGLSYQVPAGTVGNYFVGNGSRLNKTALNALLAGFGKPLVP